uniref:Uncharacterized protein n=1 Tax=Avena sativa TaxID=4498 RepID=A0ACD5TS41_AVESA
MSQSEGVEVTRRRCRRSPAAQASLTGSDDILREILLRLPPQSSSLPRASAVCKQWRRLVTDLKFHRHFRAHHGKPPLLGVFHGRGNAFRSLLDPPDRIPPERLDLRRCQTGGMKADVLGCRHGRVLLMDSPRKKLTVCDPITGKCHHIDAPPVFKGLYAYGAVICAAADQDPCTAAATRAGPFKSLAVIKGPPCLNASLKHQIIEADDGAVGLAMFSHGRLEMWQRRKVNSHGGATWLLHKTVEMHTVLGLPPQVEGWMTGMVILGYDDEDKGSIFVHFGTNVYMVQLVSMQSRKLYKSDCAYNFHPFTSFYAPAIHEGDEADMLHDP